MNIYVCVKQTPDSEAVISLKDETQVDESDVRWILNPYDEFALEEAVRFKAERSDCEVIAVSLGPKRVESTIRMAYALGADRGIHILHDGFLDFRSKAEALANAIKRDGAYSIIFAGKQAIDDCSCQVPARIARYLKASIATDVFAFAYNDGKIQVTKDGGDGERLELELSLPAVIAVDKGLNTPRYPGFIKQKKAKDKAIEKLSLQDIGIDPDERREEIARLSNPPERSAGVILSGDSESMARQLASLLRKKEKVI